MTAPATTWLRADHARPGQLNLICFPHAGAGAVAFNGWTPLLAPTVRPVAVQLPGREDRIREPRYESLGPLLDDLVPVLAEHVAPPFAFFGHSMGALVAYEAARRMRAQGLPGPRHLFVSGRPAPHLRDHARPIGGLPHDDFLTALRSLNGFPAEVLADEALTRLVAPTLRSDFRVCEGYVHRRGAPLDCPISVFGGTADDVTRQDLAEWAAHTNVAFRLRMLPGDHFFVMAECLRVLAAICDDLCQPALVTGGERA